MNTRNGNRGRLPQRPLALAIVNTLGSLAVAFALPAFAEDPSATDEASQLETVEVEGRPVGKPASPKFTAPLLDTPQTVSIIPAEVFNSQGAQNLTDVLRNTPGISFSAGENGFATNNNNFSLRGFDTSGSIYIDGVRDSGNYPRDVFNLETVEVAKGPAADNGRGGMAGYVNLVTKSASLADFTRGTASYGADSTDADARARATFDLNRQIGETSAVRVNLLYQDSGIAGREHAEADAVGIAPSIAFGLGTDTRITLSAQYLEQSGRPDWGVPGALIRGTINYDAAAARADRDLFYGLASDFDDNDSLALLAKIEHDFGNGFTLGNVTRWSDTERKALYSVPSAFNAQTQLVTAQTQAYQRDNDGLANLTNLTGTFSTGSLAHTLSAGLELSREGSDALRFGTSNAPLTPVLAPDFRRAVARFPQATQSNKVDIDSVAVYVYDTIKFNDQWQLTGGLRGERYEVDIASKNLDGTPQGSADGYRLSDTSLSGKLGLVYKPSENGSLYASIGIATLPPGSWLSNPDISRTGDNAFPGLVGQNNDEAKPQRSVNHELGVKWNFFDERLIATAAVFSTERRSVAIAGKEPGQPDSPTVLRGYGKQHVDGIELGISGRLTEAWTIFAGAVILDSERELSDYLAAAHRQANPNDYGAVTSVDGDELAFTPKRSANLWTTYQFGSGLIIGGGVQHVGESWAGRPDDADRIIPNGRFGKLPGYTVTNLMASYAVSEQISLRLNIDNVGDKLYATSGNWPMTRVFLGPPRSYLLSADFRF